MALGDGGAAASAGDTRRHRPRHVEVEGVGGPASFALAVTIGAIAVLSFVLGYLGLHDYIPALRPSLYNDRPIDLLYYDLQLFVINSAPVSNGGPYPLALEIARFTAPAATVYAVLAAARVLLDAQVRQIRARLSRRHSVVCGGGAMALSLARRLRQEGRNVVLIDEVWAARDARAAGLLHVAGDPAEVDVLRRAGLARAAELFVLHPDSAASAAIVLAASRVARPHHSPDCYAAIGDREICAGLHARHVAWPSPWRLRLNLLNHDDLAAQAILDAEPPDERGERHIAVVGLGDLGQALIVALARRHSVAIPGDERPILTMVDANALDVCGRVARQAPALDRAWNVRPRAVPAEQLDEDALTDLLAREPPPDRVYVCCGDDSTSLRIGFRALRARNRNPVRVVVSVARGSAFSAAFHGDDRLFDDAQGTLSVLAVEELMVRPQLIRNGLVTEQIARSMHDTYLAVCLEQRETPRSRPSLWPWDELADDLKEANRDNARHVGVNLEAIGCILVPAVDIGARFEFRDDSEVRILARLDHDRWVRERRSRGYYRGPERVGFQHPNMVPWDELPGEVREQAERLVRQLPDALAEAGFQVLRLATTG